MNSDKNPRSRPESEDADDAGAPEHDEDLDLDLEELDEGDRLKEGFTGQER